MSDRPGGERTEATLAAALKQFGWTCGPEFWRRYYTDQWVFNLANAVETLLERVDGAARAVEVDDG